MTAPSSLDAKAPGAESTLRAKKKEINKHCRIIERFRIMFTAHYSAHYCYGFKSKAIRGQLTTT